jgi:hypothetical protein
LLDKQTRLVTAFALAAVLFNGLSGLLAARSLGNLQFSAFTSSLAIITTLQIFFQGLQFSADLNTKTEKRVSRKRFVTEGIILTTIIGMVLFLFRSQLNSTPFQSLVICFMVFPGLASASAVGFFLSKNDFVRFQLLSTLTAGIRILLTLILLIFALFIVTLKSPAVFLGLVLLSNIFSLFIMKIRTPHIRITQTKVLTWGNWNSVVSVSSGWLLVQGDLILFHSILPAKEAGQISAYSTVAKIFISLVGLIGLTQSSRIRNLMNPRQNMVVILKLTLISSVFAAIAYQFGSFFIKILYGADYIIDSDKLPLLILSNSIWAVFSGLLYIQLKLNNNSSLTIKMCILLLMTILALILFPLTYENTLKISTAVSLVGTFTLALTRTKT